MNKGFTLIELLVYLGLVAMITTALIFWSIDLNAVGDKSYALTEVGANRQLINNFLSNKIKTAAAVLEPTVGNFSNELKLIDALSGDSLEFAMTNGRLWLSENGRPALPLSSAAVVIDNLSFTNLTTPFANRSNIAWEFDLSYGDERSPVYTSQVSTHSAASQRP